MKEPEGSAELIIPIKSKEKGIAYGLIINGLPILNPYRSNLIGISMCMRRNHEKIISP
jgi:hypothetical protein